MEIKKIVAEMKIFIWVVLFLAFTDQVLIFMSRLMKSKTYGRQNTLDSEARRQRGHKNINLINKILSKNIGLIQVMYETILSLGDLTL